MDETVSFHPQGAQTGHRNVTSQFTCNFTRGTSVFVFIFVTALLAGWGWWWERWSACTSQEVASFESKGGDSNEVIIFILPIKVQKSVELFIYKCVFDCLFSDEYLVYFSYKCFGHCVKDSQFQLFQQFLLTSMVQLMLQFSYIGIW